jgi:acyl-CoA thioester hydrolase
MDTSDHTGAGRAPIVGEVTRRVPPRHCDAQAMMHASRPAEYFEDAFLAWLDLACAGYDNLRAAGADLVIAESTIRYLGSVHLGDVVTTTATPTERGRTSLRIRFDLIRQGEVLVTATTAYVCVARSGPVEIPAVLDPLLSCRRRFFSQSASATWARLVEVADRQPAGGGGLRSAVWVPRM